MYQSRGTRQTCKQVRVSLSTVSTSTGTRSASRPASFSNSPQVAASYPKLHWIVRALAFFEVIDRICCSWGIRTDLAHCLVAFTVQRQVCHSGDWYKASGNLYPCDADQSEGAKEQSPMKNLRFVSKPTSLPRSYLSSSVCPRIFFGTPRLFGIATNVGLESTSHNQLYHI